MIEKLKKYRLIYEQCMLKIDALLREEMDNYSDFLYNNNITALPDGVYCKNGEKLDKDMVRELYNNFAAKK